VTFVADTNLSSWQIEHGEERFIRQLDPDCWISVVYRITGFGWHEWETAICFQSFDAAGKRDFECHIIAGDRRRELENMPKELLMPWYTANIEGNRNSMDTLLEALKAALAAKENEK
jgi:hypothetical protein